MTNDALFRLDSRTALVTGASSGLGRHFAMTLARSGARVVAAARRKEQLGNVVDEIKKLGGRAQAVQLDVASSGSVRDCFNTIADTVGVADIILNAAGVTTSKPILEQTEEDWDTTLDTNLKGSWLVAQEGARRLAHANKSGSIINVASILGQRVAGGVAPYAASKAGLLHLTRALALELARYDIRANALLPGYVRTGLNEDFLSSDGGEKLRKRIPTRRFGVLEDLDGPLLLLASPAGQHLTGAAITADGGHSVSSL